jgi:hypothetical protein
MEMGGQVLLRTLGLHVRGLLNSKKRNRASLTYWGAIKYSLRLSSIWSVPQREQLLSCLSLVFGFFCYQSLALYQQMRMKLCSCNKENLDKKINGTSEEFTVYHHALSHDSEV